MPALGTLKPFVSTEDYLAGESHGEIRHEYLDGQRHAVTGAGDRHGLIVNAIAYALTLAARRSGCQLFTRFAGGLLGQPSRGA